MSTDCEKPPTNSGNWISRHSADIDKILTENLYDASAYSSVLIKLLAKKGLDSQEKIESFLNPSLKDLHDPNLLPNIALAVKRLIHAIKSNQKVLVFGDYDADGIVSTAIMYNFLKKIGVNADYYIPSRFEDGYDININYIIEQNFNKTCDLIICVDCGTNAAEVMNYVKHNPENNIDVIVCDHHEAVSVDTPKNTGKDDASYNYAGDSHNKDNINTCNSLNEGSNNNLFSNNNNFPEEDGKKINNSLDEGATGSMASLVLDNSGNLKHNNNSTGKDNDTDSESNSGKSYILVNPKLQGSKYPFSLLSGAGVTFKFITATLRTLDETVKEKIPGNYLSSILDLVAISTVADLMPLTDENRIIVKEGLKRIKNSTNSGLNMLVSKILGDKEEFSSYDIGFVISPRLNASGRMSNAQNSLKLLLDNEHVMEEIFKMEISSIIDEMEKSNSDRKDIQQKTVKEILENNDFSSIVTNEKIFIAKSDTWNVGVIGIAASEIVKKYNIPVILFIESDGILKGSGRSIPKFDLYENLGTLSRYFKKYGGHKQACGITMELKYFKDFKSSMIKLANEMLTEEDLKKVYYFDIEIVFSEINFKLTSDISKLEPFGMENTRPVFQTKGCKISGEPRLLKDNKHMVIKFKNAGKEFEGIIFNCSDLFPYFTDYIVKNRKNKALLDLLQIDILYNIESKKSPYDDTRIIQLCIQSLRVEPDLIN